MLEVKNLSVEMSGESILDGLDLTATAEGSTR